MDKRKPATCEAVADHQGIGADGVSFRRGDTLFLVEKTDANNVRVKVPSTGRVGVVPATCVRIAGESSAVAGRQKDPAQDRWFHGRITREAAEALLIGGSRHGDGHFLVHESTNFAGDYTLCVSFENTVQHYRVMRLDDGRLTIDEDVHFGTLGELIDHYRADRDCLVTELVSAVEKVPSQIKSIGAAWKIVRGEIILGKTIGSGQFGAVYEATYRGQKVAVKTLKDADAVATDFLGEAAVMTKLQHPNLVQLLGVCTDGSPIYIVTEFMAKGCLLDYLRSRGRGLITAPVLLEIATQIGSAMVYLESMGVVHRDLAARNILIGDNNVAKVADLGLARPADMSAPVSNEKEGKIPIKWTAPEALESNAFTHASDVWSFAVVLWELYSYGRTPYPRMSPEEVVSQLKGGYRMEAPEGCPPAVYAVMRSCWQVAPEQRPTFVDIERLLNRVPKT
eukprot:Opistho-2@90386